MGRPKTAKTITPYHQIHNNPARLSRREGETARLVTLECSVVETASIMGLAPTTVDNTKTRAFKKIGAHNMADLTRAAIRLGIITADEELTSAEKKRRHEHSKKTPRRGD